MAGFTKTAINTMPWEWAVAELPLFGIMVMILIGVLVSMKSATVMDWMTIVLQIRMYIVVQKAHVL